MNCVQSSPPPPLSLFFPLYLWLDSPIWAWASPFHRGFTITHFRHTTVGRTPLDEGPAHRRDLYLTTHNTHKIQTSMSPLGFEPTILVSERPKTHALDRTATGIGCVQSIKDHFKHFSQSKNRMSDVEVLALSNLVSVPKPSDILF
jgi:hypothetical protein